MQTKKEKRNVANMNFLIRLLNNLIYYTIIYF